MIKWWINLSVKSTSTSAYSLKSATTAKLLRDKKLSCLTKTVKRIHRSATPTTTTTDSWWERWRISGNGLAGCTEGYLLLSLGFIRVASEEAARPLNVTAFIDDTRPLLLSAHWSRLPDSHGSNRACFECYSPTTEGHGCPQYGNSICLFRCVAQCKFMFLFVKWQRGHTSPPCMLEWIHTDVRRWLKKSRRSRVKSILRSVFFISSHDCLPKTL